MQLLQRRSFVSVLIIRQSPRIKRGSAFAIETTDNKIYSRFVNKTQHIYSALNTNLNASFKVLQLF